MFVDRQISNQGEYSLSFVIPVKNDSRVVSCVDTLLNYAEREKISAEVIVCGLLDHNVLLKGVRFLEVATHRKGECARTGVLASNGAVIIICDADLPVTFGDLNLLRSALNNADISLGNRCLPYSTIVFPPPYRRRVASIIFRFLVRVMFNLRGFDTQCGIKAFKREAGQMIFRHQIIKGFSFDVEIVIRARNQGLRIAQVPVHWRSSPNSTIRVSKVAPAMFKELLNLWIK